MRRFRLPTIPNMGLPSKKRGDNSLQAYDSAIFADAEEESPRVEKRPSAPHIFGFPRRSHSKEKERYQDALKNGKPLEKRPSTAAKLKTLASLTVPTDSIAPRKLGENDCLPEDREEQLPSHGEYARVHNKTEERPSSSPESEISPNPSNPPLRNLLSRQAKKELPSVASSAHSSRKVSSTNSSSIPRKNVLFDAIQHSCQRAVGTTNKFQNRLPRNVVPWLKQKARVAFSFIVAIALALFAPLQWSCNAISAILDKVKARRIRQGEVTLRTSSSVEALETCNLGGERSNIKSKENEQIDDTEFSSTLVYKKSVSESPPIHRDDETLKNRSSFEVPEPNDTNVERSMTFKSLGNEQIADTEFPSTTLGSKESVVASPSTETRQESNTKAFHVAVPLNTVVNGEKSGEKLTPLSSNMTEETMTVVPMVSFSDEKREDNSNEQKPFKQHRDDELEDSTDETKLMSKSGGTFGRSSSKESDANESDSETSKETSVQGRNSTEIMIKSLDQRSMRFERKDSEIILSPLEAMTPTFASDTEYGVMGLRGVNAAQEGRETAWGPRGRSTELDLPTRPSSKRKGSRGPTGRLKSDARTMKHSLLRVFGRNRTEPETRFASPRSARKTLALVADMLVRELGCDVGIRRNGALKMRCERSYPGNQKLRVRLAFQPMDAFSCNVVVCRSREDDLQVSTTDYVAFVADLQRFFLNATSEGMHGALGS